MTQSSKAFVMLTSTQRVSVGLIALYAVTAVVSEKVGGRRA